MSETAAGQNLECGTCAAANAAANTAEHLVRAACGLVKAGDEWELAYDSYLSRVELALPSIHDENCDGKADLIATLEMLSALQPSTEVSAQIDALIDRLAALCAPVDED